MLSSNEIRTRFLEFFKNKDHAIIPSASLVPENDPSSLFINSGMQPLVPYLLGQTHPQGKRLANFQKVIRTIDIDEVGDNTHLTFFEMMGNWSLGDYFKKEAISWSYELLTSKEIGFGLDPKRLYVTCFEGDNNAPKDEESAQIWREIFTKANIDPNKHIFFLPASKNWWSPGDNGPCGPDTEMYYDVTENGLGDLSHEEFVKADDAQEVVEIWNDVFMEYQKKDSSVIGKLSQKNVDTGSGFERVVTVVQGKKNVFETDLFADALNLVRDLADKYNEKKARIIVDHIKAAMFIISSDIKPSNTDQGYVARRLIRRAVYFSDSIGIPADKLVDFINLISDKYKDFYPEIANPEIRTEIETEESKFRKTLEKGLREFEKIISKSSITGEDAFKLFSTYGFPFELTKEISRQKGIMVGDAEFEKEFTKHKELSRTASAGKFKGGLAGSGEQETKYHTATHLLHAALRHVLGDHVFQKGSNITAERLRFDFSHHDKMTDEEKKAVEDWVNEKIKHSLPVIRKEMSFSEAKDLGAMGLFEDKYGDVVSVYTIGQEPHDICSIELCGGPHVENTSTIGTFKIKKEEASSAGVRRIKAVIE